MRVEGLLGLLSILALNWGCQTASSGPSLLSLTGMSPREIELGDELEISGSGFPEGKSARVVFQGDLYRAGSKVDKDQQIVARTTSLSPRALTLAINDELRAAFTGKDDEARHTTFRGDIEVSFASKKPGAAPVTGTLSDVVLDVEPGLLSPTLQRQRDAVATDALAYLGIELRAPEEGDCCVVQAATGRAASAGLRPGDKIVDLDGVTVKSRWDLVPSSERRTSRLSFRGETGPVVVRELDVQGYHSAVPSELGPALGIIGFLLGLLCVSSTRLGLPALFYVRSLAQALRERASRAKSSPGRASSRMWTHHEWLGLSEDPQYHLLGASFLGGMWVMSVALSLRIEMVSKELDLVLWCLLETVSVGWAACLVMAKQRKGVLRSALRASCSALLHQLPLLMLVVGCVFETQSLRLFDLVDAQGPWPLAWNVFRNPPWLLLTGLAVMALVPVIEPASPLRASARNEGSGRLAHLSFGFGRVLGGTVHLWSSALLLGMVAFGGFRVPGISSSAQASSIPWQLVGAALLLLKGWGLVSLVTGIRGLAGQLQIEDSLELGLRYGIGLLALSAVGAIGWIWMSRTLALGWLDEVTSVILLSTTLTTVVAATYRAVTCSRVPRGKVAVSPWM